MSFNIFLKSKEQAADKCSMDFLKYFQISEGLQTEKEKFSKNEIKEYISRRNFRNSPNNSRGMCCYWNRSSYEWSGLESETKAPC